MTEWRCPACHGGFPEPHTSGDDADDGHIEVDKTCPWCGESLHGWPRDIEVPDPPENGVQIPGDSIRVVNDS